MVKYLSAGDCVFACYIPSSGPLSPEAVISNLEWIFYRPYGGRDSLKLMPEDTKLQKILKKFYLDGGTQGVGTGIIIFDGERIVNK